MAELPTLTEMLRRGGGKIVSRSAWVSHPGFEALYVRVGKKYIAGQVHENVVDLANIQATNPGQGTFRKLIGYLQDKWPQYDIHVENALTQRFQAGLKRMGFLETGIPQCFWLPRN
jgi:hypothetical protein